MKKITFIGMATLMLGVSILGSGCFGKFALVRKVYEWNDSLGNNFVKTLVFYGLNIIPVYGFAGAIDFWILNLIEFWTGSNPMAMKAGETEKQVVLGKDGNQYEITATQNRFDVVALSGTNKGTISSLVYTPENKTWNKEVNGSGLTPIATVHEDLNKVEIFASDGSVRMVDMNTMFLNSVAN